MRRDLSAGSEGLSGDPVGESMNPMKNSTMNGIPLHAAKVRSSSHLVPSVCRTPGSFRIASGEELTEHLGTTRSFS